jgi:DNA-binding Xre family transcriptional regulator
VRISYNKLWKLLIDKKIRQSDLRRAANIAPNTLTRLYRDQDVKLDVLYRICMVLEADIGDIMEFLPEEEQEGEAEQ